METPILESPDRSGSRPLPHPTVQFRGRVRSGCRTCRTRKVKCDEQRPNCHNCTRLSRTCIWDESAPRRKSASISRSVASNSPKSNPAPTQSPTASGGPYVFPQPSPYATQLELEETVFRQDEFMFTSAGLTPPGQDVFAIDEERYQLTFDAASQSTFVPWVGSHLAMNGLDSIISDPHAAMSQNGTSQTQALPLLEEQPFMYFLDHVEPPFISPCDNSNWIRMRSYIAEHGFANQVVAAAILAVQALYKAVADDQDTTNAMSLYYTAKGHYAKMLEDDQQDLHSVLMVAFLLCCFEIVAQAETISITIRTDGAFVKKLERWAKMGTWPPVSRRFEAWLRILHAKAKHLGGRGLLSVTVQNLLPNDQDPTPNLSNLDYFPDPTAAIYDNLASPLFEFFLELQKITVDITGGMNRHNRSRGTAADEREVHELAKRIDSRIRTLWERRTGLLKIDPATLIDHLPPTIAEPLSELISICLASYYAEILDLGRGYGKFLTATPEMQDAMREIRRIIDSTATPGVKLNAGYLWPLFLYTAECTDRENGLWAVGRLRQIKCPWSHSDFIADVADGLNEEQIKRGKRVDSKYFCAKNYGVQPPFI